MNRCRNKELLERRVAATKDCRSKGLRTRTSGFVFEPRIKRVTVTRNWLDLMQNTTASYIYIDIEGRENTRQAPRGRGCRPVCTGIRRTRILSSYGLIRGEASLGVNFIRIVHHAYTSQLINFRTAERKTALDFRSGRFRPRSCRRSPPIYDGQIRVIFFVKSAPVWRQAGGPSEYRLACSSGGYVQGCELSGIYRNSGISIGGKSISDVRVFKHFD